MSAAIVVGSRLPRRRRVAVAGAIVVGAAALHGAGLGLPWAILESIAAVRAASRGDRWLRRRRLRAETEGAVIVLARCLAAELGAGCGTSEAVIRAATASCPNALAATLLDGARRRVELGASPTAALRASCRVAAAADPDATAGFERLVRMTAMGERSVPAARRGLRRLADSVEAERAVRREIGATASEARTVAVALPVITAAMAGGITMISPRSALVLTTSWGAPLAGGAALVACCGIAGVFRLTRPWR